MRGVLASGRVQLGCVSWGATTEPLARYSRLHPRWFDSLQPAALVESAAVVRIPQTGARVP